MHGGSLVGWLWRLGGMAVEAFFAEEAGPGTEAAGNKTFS
jgi:hypothetical protein